MENVARTSDQVAVEVKNKVLKNTYMLLGATLAFSGLAAWFSMSSGMPAMNPWVMLAVYFGLLFGVNVTRNSGWALLFVFGLTGFLGLTVGPMLNAYMNVFSNGAELITTALGGTAVVFFGMSGIALVSKKDFSFMGKFLFAGVLVSFVCSLVALFFNIGALSLAVSAAFMMLSAGLILYETSNIVNGGETNYVMATVSLFVSIFNLFVSMLNLLGAFQGED